MRMFLALGAILFTVAGCDGGHDLAAEDVDLESLLSQCGTTWDVQDVESYDGTLGVSVGMVDAAEGPVGFHVDAICTGTLVADDLFLSAGHCNYAVGDTVRFNFQDDPFGNPRPTTDFTVDAVLESENNADYDYAIVRLDGNAGAQFGIQPIHHSNAPVNDTVAIIQHPAGVPKVVHAGPVLDYNSPIGDNWFRYQVDTTGGTSGSGVLNTDGRIVGVHTNAGCSTGNPINGNSGMQITELWSHSFTLSSIFQGWDYCTPGNPCPAGFGDCDSNSDCATGVCRHNIGQFFGWDENVDVCIEATFDWDRCANEECGAGFGDCDGDVQCVDGNRCATNIGDHFGYSGAGDICIPDDASRIPPQDAGFWNFNSASDWTEVCGSTGHTERSDDEYYTSGWAMQIYDPDPNAPECTQSRGVPVVPGRSYTLEAWAYRVSGTNSQSMYIRWYDADGNMISQVSEGIYPPANDWEQVTLVATAPANAETAEILLYSWGGGVSNYYWDEVWIYPT